MDKFTITSRAREDLKDIGRYTKRIWGRAKRIEYLDLLRSRMRDLANGKLSGRRCYDIAGFPWSSHVGGTLFSTARHLHGMELRF